MLNNAKKMGQSRQNTNNHFCFDRCQKPKRTIFCRQYRKKYQLISKNIIMYKIELTHHISRFAFQTFQKHLITLLAQARKCHQNVIAHFILQQQFRQISNPIQKYVSTERRTHTIDKHPKLQLPKKKLTHIFAPTDRSI
jgi:hypothetical protein